MDINLKIYDNIDILLICGLPGSGKSYFAKQHFESSDRKRINRAEIRRLLYEMSHFGKEWHESDYSETDEVLVKHVEKKIIEHHLHHNIKVLIDNTSVTKLSRKYYLEIAKATKKTIAVIFINTPIQVCLQRNRQRTDKKPENVISNLFASIEIPDTREGFNNSTIFTG